VRDRHNTPRPKEKIIDAMLKVPYYIDALLNVQQLQRRSAEGINCCTLRGETRFGYSVEVK